MQVSFPGESAEYRVARERLLAEEISLRRAMEAVAAAEMFVLASLEKLGAASPYAVVGLDEISGIITERAADKGLTKPFEKMKIAVIRA